MHILFIVGGCLAYAFLGVLLAQASIKVADEFRDRLHQASWICWMLFPVSSALGHVPDGPNITPFDSTADERKTYICFMTIIWPVKLVVNAIVLAFLALFRLIMGMAFAAKAMIKLLNRPARAPLKRENKKITKIRISYVDELQHKRAEQKVAQAKVIELGHEIGELEMRLAAEQGGAYRSSENVERLKSC